MTYLNVKNLVVNVFRDPSNTGSSNSLILLGEADEDQTFQSLAFRALAACLWFHDIFFQFFAISWNLSISWILLVSFGFFWILLTLSVPTFFNVFTTFRKLVVIQLILAIKTQTVYQIKDIIHGSLLVESIFEITFKKADKSVYGNPIFLGMCGNPHIPWYSKG